MCLGHLAKNLFRLKWVKIKVCVRFVLASVFAYFNILLSLYHAYIDNRYYNIGVVSKTDY